MRVPIAAAWIKPFRLSGIKRLVGLERDGPFGLHRYSGLGTRRMFELS